MNRHFSNSIHSCKSSLLSGTEEWDERTGKRKREEREVRGEGRRVQGSEGGKEKRMEKEGKGEKGDEKRGKARGEEGREEKEWEEKGMGSGEG